MATGLATKKVVKVVDALGSPEGPRPYLLTVEQYRKMIDAGVFSSSDRVELLGGKLIEKMTNYPPHSFGVDAIAAVIRTLLGNAWTVREEKAINLDGDSRPEPDIVVARGPRETYRTRDPSQRDIVLIVEVADSSYRDDRDDRWVRYAAAKVPAYAILNISARRLELYGKPSGSGPSACYREVMMFEDSESMPLTIGRNELGRIAVRDVLP